MKFVVVTCMDCEETFMVQQRDGLFFVACPFCKDDAGLEDNPVGEVEVEV